MTPIEKQFNEAIDSILFSTEDAVFPESAARLCYAIHKRELDKDRRAFLQWLEKNCYMNANRIIKYNGSQTGLNLIDLYAKEISRTTL